MTLFEQILNNNLGTVKPLTQVAIFAELKRIKLFNVNGS
jgi:hypothetical protein